MVPEKARVADVFQTDGHARLTFAILDEHADVASSSGGLQRRLQHLLHLRVLVGQRRHSAVDVHALTATGVDDTLQFVLVMLLLLVTIGSRETGLQRRLQLRVVAAAACRRCPSTGESLVVGGRGGGKGEGVV